MAKKGKGRSHGRFPAAPQPPASDPPRSIARGALVLALVGVGLLVDTGVGPGAAFDAPKRLAAMVLTAVAAGALAFSPSVKLPLARPRGFFSSGALVLAAAALLGCFLSALLSPRRVAALDTFRAILLFALLLLLGASRALDGRKKWLLAAWLGVLTINAVVSILQAREIYQPFALETGGRLRESTGAYVGNVGYLAQALALGAVVALGIVFCARRPALRFPALLASILFVGALLGNRTLTSFSALLAGGAILSLCLLRRWAILAAAGAVLLLAVVVMEYRPMRHRVMGAVRAAQAGDWNLFLTYREGPWRAALSMTRERPLLGFGPGTFGAEFAPHRLAAEISSHRRFPNPALASSYTETHCDYLQLFAEDGIPAGLAGLGSILFLFLGLIRTVRRSSGQARNEIIVLSAFLTAGAIAALTWFPMQRPITAIPLLLAAGRAWRVSDDSSEAVEKRLGPGLRILLGVLALVVLFLLVRPEWSRYLAERQLGLAQRSLRALVSQPAAADQIGALSRISDLVSAAAASLPADPRPAIFLGNLRMISGEPAIALERYRQAFALGERPEIDLHIGRAYETLGETGKASQAYVRAVWISPALLGLVPPEDASPVSSEISRLETQLQANRLRAPPPAP